MKQAGGLAAALALLAAPAAAQPDDWSAPPPPWEGVWRGTVGTLAAHLCLDTTPSRNHGAYYYDRHRALIRLETSDDGRNWVEQSSDDRPGARLKIAAVGKDALTGSWSNGEAKLLMRMRRVGPASADFEGPCGSIRFHRPRVTGAAIAKSHSAKDGTALTKWRFEPGAPFDDIEVSTFTLDQPGPAIARVNAMLRAVLPSPDGGGDWLDCVAGNANAHGADGEFSETIEPVLVTRRWLAATHRSDTYCGGAHPDTSVTFRTFDLSLGAEVDPLDWLEAAAVKVERYDGTSGASKALTPAFRKFLLAGYRAESEDCAGVIADQQYWSVGIERGSLMFWPQLPRVVMACSEDFKVPLERIQPWLNAQGKAIVATLPR